MFRRVRQVAAPGARSAVSGCILFSELWGLLSTLRKFELIRPTLELSILAVESPPGQKLLEGSTKVAIEDGVDDWIQRRVAVTEPEYDSEHRTWYLQSGQH